MRLAPLWLLPIAVVLAGCPAKAQQFGGSPRQGSAPRVVSLSPGTTEIIVAQMEARLLVGRTEKDDYPPSAASIPVVAGVKPDFEKIKSVSPTFVVYDADLYNADDVKRIEGMGAESFAFKAHTVAGFEKELYELSSKLGSETGISGYVDRIERTRNEAADRTAATPKVAIVLGNGDYVAGTESFLADVIAVSGGKAVGPASDKFAPMSAEATVAAAPDVIILAASKDSAAKQAAELQANPRFANSPAVKNGRIAAIDESVVLRRGSRVDALIRGVHRALTIGQKTP